MANFEQAREWMSARAGVVEERMGVVVASFRLEAARPDGGLEIKTFYKSPEGYVEEKANDKVFAPGDLAPQAEPAEEKKKK